MKHLEKIQNLLPVGYLYLILLGLLKQSILYYQLGINIIKYSSITDILISPIADLSVSPARIITILSIFLLFFIIQTVLVRNSHKEWARRILGRNRFSLETSKQEIQKVIFPFFVLIAGVELLAFFFGLGIGGGAELSKKIIHNNFTCNYKANFNSGKSEDIYLFDLNSTYYFYVTKGSKNIKIAPIATINNLELIANEKLK